MNILGLLPYWSFGPWPKEPLMLGPLPLQIHSFGLLVAVGILLTFAICAKRAETKYGASGEEFQNFALFVVMVGWPLSHVFDVLFYNPAKLLEDPLELFRFWGSISSYGGLIGGFIGYLIWVRRNPHWDRVKLAEIATFGLAVPWFFGRIGCATVHDHPGHLADAANFPFWGWLRGIVGGPEIFPLALDFPARANLPAGPRHDLGFYEAIWWGLICVIIFWLDRKPRAKGFYIALIPMLYAPGRFLFDFLRVPPEMGGDARYLGMTPAQYMSIGIFLFGAIMWYRVKDKPPMVWTKYVPKREREAQAARERAQRAEQEEAAKAAAKANLEPDATAKVTRPSAAKPAAASSAATKPSAASAAAKPVVEAEVDDSDEEDDGEDEGDAMSDGPSATKPTGNPRRRTRK